MKKCTYCGKEYSDDKLVCEVDAQPLSDLPVIGDTPEAVTAGKIAYTDAEVLEIAYSLEFLILIFMLFVLFCFVAVLFPVFIPFAKILIPIIFFVSVYRIAQALRCVAVLWAILALLPLINLLVIINFIGKAKTALRQRGIGVGYLGARKEDLEKLDTNSTD